MEIGVAAAAVEVVTVDVDVDIIVGIGSVVVAEGVASVDYGVVGGLLEVLVLDQEQHIDRL